MFILDVSVGVSFRNYLRRYNWFCFLLEIRFYVVYIVVVELVGGWRVGSVGAPQLHLICGSVSASAAGPRRSPRPRPRVQSRLAVAPAPRRTPPGARATRRRRPAASLHAVKAFLVVLETPSRIKPLKFWALGCMHWLV